MISALVALDIFIHAGQLPLCSVAANTVLQPNERMHKGISVVRCSALEFSIVHKQDPKAQENRTKEQISNSNVTLLKRSETQVEAMFLCKH